ncbi:gliding motility-associated C-terminal domain-containing protein [Lewinella sp. W8]|uniref:T9SS type B sorting domain-containing protein n=1 Tax=Lewinella sp. W8 TaxID=2528208 RepID=UPI001067373F|nr:gliding motility-associated C-terminal domain-containing protein [Lewinella sp. W8]MTB52050.1 T9SS type B sorting domain-containing protein [Lewinella sp. W8]
MNRSLFPIGRRCSVFAVLFSLFFFFSATAFAQGPPFFNESAPDDTTADCFGDIEAGETLEATVPQSDGPDLTAFVVPRDSLSSPDAICAGGTLFRIWEVSNSAGTAREVQRIVFGPAADGDGPSINFSLLPPQQDTVDCRSVNDPLDPDGYDRWLGDRRVAVAAAAQAGCAPIISIVDDAPPSISNFDCDDQLEVTFLITDDCNRFTTVGFVYVTVDTVGPELIGINSDTIRLSCADPIPAPANVMVVDCSPSPVLSFNETNTQLLDGSCREYEYDIIRVYSATDDCGNSTTIQQVIEVRDTEAPSFGRPPNLTLNCTFDPFDLDVTGRPTEVMDNCTPTDSLDISFNDLIISTSGCGDNFQIRRTWRVTDRCGNSRVRIQEIRVRDDFAPTFNPPVDSVMVNCADYLNTELTGTPTDVFDDCDPTPNLSFEDEIIPGDCPGNFTVNRRWRIFDDCDNSRFFTQHLTVIDTTAPVFLEMPQNLISSCNNERSQADLLVEWVNNLAGARFADACTAEDDLTVSIVESGTDNFPMLPPLSCAEGDGTVRRLSVDVIVSDQCGNTSIATVEYRQIDELPVNIFNCPESQVIPTDPGNCAAMVALPPPVIEDQCVSGLPFQLLLRDTATITSMANNPAELGSVPVDPLTFNLPVGVDLPVNGFAAGTLEITLENIDAEGAEEFFTILGEDDTVLGVTANGEVQCSDVETTVTLPAALFNRYAVDGVVTIRLIPNIPADRPGTFAINNLCDGGSRAYIFLRQPVFRLTDIVYEVSIDGEDFMTVDPIDTVFTTLDLGLHQIRYRATDCGGNTDECLYTITVEDREPPVVTCPDDVVLFTNEDSCRVALEVPLPVAVSDNCEAYELISFEAPASLQDRFFPFFFDPNLNDFLAGEMVLNISGIPAQLYDSVDIDLRFVGRFDNQRAVLDVVLSDGTVLGSTQRGDATCMTEGLLRMTIGAEEFMALVNNGNTTISLRPRAVTVPPASPGDGLIPCDGSTIENEGATDGNTYAYLTLTFRTLYPQFFASGATEIPLTQTNEAAPAPFVNFNQGITNLSYLVTDLGGNTDTCTIQVSVLDTIAPIAVCQPTTVFIDPSGLSPVTVDPVLVDGGSSDNCGIDSFLLAPNNFTCDRIGTTENVTLQVFDAAGNVDSCSTIISIAAQEPMPTASTTVCGGDTLRLMANPPTAAGPGQVIYTFRWFDPNGNLISTSENPVIPGVDEDNDGAYRVEIRGITGCVAEGVVNINIGEVPPPPTLDAPMSVCFGEMVPLRSTSTYVGAVVYEWYRGIPGDAVFLGTSTSDNFMASFAAGQNSGSFFAIALVNGCSSTPSAIVNVGSTTRPVASIIDETIEVCEFGTANLVTTAQAGLSFRWSGPNGFSAQGQVASLTNIGPEDAGFYYLEAIREEGCISLRDSVEVIVTPATPPTNLLVEGAVCVGDTLTLTAQDPLASNYVFFGPNGQEIATTSPTLRLAPVTAAVAGEWRVSVQRGECPSAPGPVAVVTLGVSPEATTMTIPDPICVGNDLILQGSSSIANSEYLWTGPNGFESSLIAPVIESVDSSIMGDYVLTVTSPSGCTDQDTLVVDLLSGLSVDSIIVAQGRCLNGGETVTLVAAVSPNEAPGNNYSFSWSGPQGTSTNDTLTIPNVSLASNGLYSLTVTDEQGCRSPRFSQQIELDFAPAAPIAPFTLDGLTNVCSGDTLALQTNDFGPGFTYLWRLPDGTNIPTSTNRLLLNELAPENSGPYTVRVVRNGCSSLPSPARMITVTAFPELSVSANAPACSGQAINFQATDLPGAVYTWRGPNNFSSSIPDPVIISADPDVHTGQYSVVAAINGCASDTMFVDVEVRPTPRVPVVQPIAPVCISDESSVLELTVNPNTTTAGASYQWYIQNGQVPIGDPTTSTTLSVSDFGLFAGGGLFGFSVRTILDGCESERSTEVNVRLDEANQEVAFAGRDTIVCEGLFLLEAGPITSGTGRWSMVAGTGDITIVNPTSRTTAVQGLSEFGGPYEFAWTLSNGSCVDYAADTITLTVSDGEEAVAGENILACIGEELFLNATPTVQVGSAGEWTQALAQEILGVVIEDPEDPNTLITGLQPDNVYSFTWTVRSNCGVKSDVVLVNVSDPSPFAGADRTVCNLEQTATLEASTPSIGSIGRWTALSDEVFITDPADPNTTVGNLAPGENFFVWEVDEGFCGDRSRDTVSIFYNEPPKPRNDALEVEFQGEISFDPLVNDDLPTGSSIRFLDAPAQGELIDNGDGTFTYRAPANFVGEIEIVYEVSSDGCETATASVFILIGQDAECRAPNIFTPNNDGMNDTFVVPCLLDVVSFPESQVTIYNQWGDEVFRSERPYANDWDGTYQGSELPVATYFFTIDFGGQREPLNGHVRIER